MSNEYVMMIMILTNLDDVTLAAKSKQSSASKENEQVLKMIEAHKYGYFL